MFVDALKAAIESTTRTKLPTVAALMWGAFAAGQITEAEAEGLSSRIELRKIVPPPPEASRKAVGSRPRTSDSLERRRRWGASGRLPPVLAARFSLGESAVLAVVADTVIRRGDCRRCIEEIAAIAGVCRSTAKKALRHADGIGLITVERRPQTAWRNLPNIVRIVSPEWQSWNRLARRPHPRGGGVKFVTGTSTEGLEERKKRELSASRRLPKRQNKVQKAAPDANPGADRPIRPAPSPHGTG